MAFEDDAEGARFCERGGDHFAVALGLAHICNCHATRKGFAARARGADAGAGVSCWDRTPSSAHRHRPKRLTAYQHRSLLAGKPPDPAPGGLPRGPLSDGGGGVNLSAGTQTITAWK